MADVQAESSYGVQAPVARTAIVELLSLALPTIAQMASYTVMQFIDTWMLAHVGDGVLPPTAAANSGIFAFSVISFGMGVLWLVNTLASQSFGRKDFAACGRYLWQGVWFGLGFAALLLPALPYVDRLFHFVGHEERLVGLEVAYLRIVVGFSVFKLVGTAFGQFLIAVDRPRAVMAASIIGVSVNAVAAWLLIFGHGGFREGGVIGAAWAQNVGTFVEMACLIGFALLPGVRRKYGLWHWRPRRHELLTLLKVGMPSGVQIVADVLAWSAFQMWVMGVFSTEAMAANVFVFRYMSVSFMPAFGISVAVTALVGRYIGEGRIDIARKRAHLGFALAGAYMIACGVFFFVGRNRLMGLFTTEPTVLSSGATLLVFAAIYQCFDAMYIIYNGALRGAGDTLIPALATGFLCWGITVFGGHYVAAHWKSLARPAPGRPPQSTG